MTATTKADGRRLLLFWSLALGVAPGSLAAQVRFFPKTESFEYPLAYPRPAAIVGRVVKTSRGESLYGAEREAEASVGEVVPVLGLSGGRHPVTLGLGLAVTARFSLDDPRTALISTDWLVGIHTTVDLAPWRIDFHLYHESSHLGDEYAEKFSVPRVDWTREVASVWVRRTMGSLAVHGSAHYTLIDELSLPRPAVGLGLDYRGPSATVAGGRLRPVVGVYTEGTAFSGWVFTTTARAGAEVAANGRAMAVSFVFLNGMSTQRQFYWMRSRYAGLELRFDF